MLKYSWLVGVGVGVSAVVGTIYMITSKYSNKIDVMLSILRHMKPKTNSSSRSVQIDDGKAIMVSYTSPISKQYNIVLPFDQNKVINMTPLKVVLYNKWGNARGITHEPGIPYPNVDYYGDNVDYIEITNTLSGLTYKFYKGDSIGYAESTYYSE